MPILYLDQIGPRDRHRIGGKALGLARLIGHGLPVPRAAVIPTDFFREFLAANGLWSVARKGGGPGLEAAIRQGRFPPDLARDLAAVGRVLGPMLAVRSSAVDEDGEEGSQAGQYISRLGVTAGEPLEDAVRDCWASLFSVNARSYRRGRGTPPSGMAVVIQSQVNPVSAGVMFTINPLTGSWNEMTVEAAWGLGESVVSGQIVPDLYRVRRPRRSPRLVGGLLARMRLKVLETQVREQGSAIQVSDHGLTEKPVDPSERTRAKLTEEQLIRLCRLGLWVEALLGEPQDVEWAIKSGGKLVLLQSRPITTARDVKRSAPVVWTRRFGGERWSEPVTPLGWSSMQEVLDWFIAYPETARRYFGGEGATKLYRMTPYFNVTVFRHLAFKFPGAAPPRFMVELLPPAEERGWLRQRAQAPDFGVYRSILSETFAERRWQRFRWNLFTNWKAWNEFEDQLDETLEPLQAVRTIHEALDRIQLCKDLLRGYVGVHICSLLFANIWYEIASSVLKSRGQGEWVATLLRGSGVNATVRTHQALWEVANGRRSLEALLAEFGHRASNSWAIFSPRWAEDPQQLQPLIDAVGAGREPVERAQSEATEEAACLKALPLGTRRLVDLTRRYLQLREDQRFHFDRILWEWKKALLWLAADLEMDIRFLEESELMGLIEGRVSRDEAALWIGRRSEAFHGEKERRQMQDDPPDFLGTEVGAEHSGSRLQGMGISAGVVTGPVRIIRSMDDAERLLPGEILVARSTDPGWTPLFLTASALIMELGGMLSHGAVVAREYRLPGVVNIAGVMDTLRDGQVVTVDGARGAVWIR